jgi:hypothetical protein
MKTNQKKDFLGLQEINESEKKEVSGGIDVTLPPIRACYWNIPPIDILIGGKLPDIWF